MSPPENKQRREVLYRSKENAPPRQNELRSQYPENLGFLWTIDAVDLINNHRPRFNLVGDTKEFNDVCAYWLPPNKKRHFRKTKGSLYRWKMGRSTLIRNDVSLDKLIKFSTASVFFQERQDNFLVARVDCTAQDVAKEEVGWTQIKFEHNPGDLSEVGFIATHDGLAASAVGSSWMPQVLPEVYNFHMRDPKVAKKPTGNGGLCGSLSILFGMAAFSAPVENAEKAIAESFKLGKWIRHNLARDGDCRYGTRGVVATIYLDPNAQGITERNLSAYEEGKYGPIFAAALPEPAPETFSEQTLSQIQYRSRAQTTLTGVPRTSHMPYLPVSSSETPSFSAEEYYRLSNSPCLTEGHSQRSIDGPRRPYPQVLSSSSLVVEEDEPELDDP